MGGWSTIAGVVGSLGKMAANSQGNEQSNDAMQSGITNAKGTMTDYYGKAGSQLTPYEQAGQQYLGDLSSGVQNGEFMTPQSNFQYDQKQDPAYQNQLNGGNQNIKSQASSMGGLFSGGTMKALQQYGTNQANQSYGQNYNRALNTYTNERDFNAQNLLNKYNQYMGLVNLGQNAANNLSNQNMQLGQGMAGLDLQSGASNAGKAMGDANAWGNFFTDISSLGGGMGSGGGGKGGGMGGMSSLGNMGGSQGSPTEAGAGQGTDFSGDMGDVAAA